MKFHGRALRFGDDINTDYIIADHYKMRSADVAEMARYVFADYEPGFAQRVRSGDLLVAGKNFGCGSARESAPRVLKAAGISCIVAASFGRIFFRNAINIGLPVVACDTEGIEDGDEMLVDMDEGSLRDLTRGVELRTAPMPGVMRAILEAEGLANYIKVHGDLVLPEAR